MIMNIEQLKAEEKRLLAEADAIRERINAERSRLEWEKLENLLAAYGDVLSVDEHYSFIYDGGSVSLRNRETGQSEALCIDAVSLHDILEIMERTTYWFEACFEPGIRMHKMQGRLFCQSNSRIINMADFDLTEVLEWLKGLRC